MQRNIKYDEYVNTHRGNVRKAFEFIKENLPGILVEDVSKYEAAIKAHDLSKWSEEEYGPYVTWWITHDRGKESEIAFRKAFLHHVHNNPHHWQYWVIPKNKGGFDTIQMPHVNVVEMICDWWSFSFKYNDPYEIFEEWKGKKDHVIMHPETRKQVENILCMLHGFLVNNHDVVDKWFDK